ncbi:class I SAM-dependent methyltransferase [Tessaracoccus sp. Z1128]
MSEPLTAEEWDRHYSHPGFVYGYRPNDFLKSQSRLLRPASRVLCLGDGEGRNGVWLAERGHDVVSLDFSAVGLGKARGLAQERGVAVETWQVDLADWVEHPDPERSWDAVVAISAHLPSALRRRVARTATRQAAPGAVLILEAFTPAQPALGSGGPTEPDRLMTRGDAVDEWDGWRPDVRLVERRIFEGMAHQGLASVVQVLGLRS